MRELKGLGFKKSEGRREKSGRPVAFQPGRLPHYERRETREGGVAHASTPLDIGFGGWMEPLLASLQDAVPWKSWFRCCRRVTPQAPANRFEPSGFICELGSMWTIRPAVFALSNVRFIGARAPRPCVYPPFVLSVTSCKIQDLRVSAPLRATPYWGSTAQDLDQRQQK